MVILRRRTAENIWTIISPGPPHLGLIVVAGIDDRLTGERPEIVELLLFARLNDIFGIQLSKRNPPWTPSLRVVAWTTAALISLLAVYWAFQPGPPPQSETLPPTGLSASGLFDRYRENHAATQYSFGEHRMAVTGTVLRTEQGESDFTITFRHDRGEFVAAIAYVQRLSWPEASRLEPGVRVTVRCVRSDWYGEGPALLKTCEL
jgi:hypothetical protein